MFLDINIYLHVVKTGKRTDIKRLNVFAYKCMYIIYMCIYIYKYMEATT